MSRPGFSFLLCPDPELLRQEIDSLEAEHGAGSTWDRRVYWGDEELTGAFWQDISIPDLMGTGRLVVVRRANKLLKDSWDKLEGSLSSFNSQIWPVFCLENAPDKKGGPKPPAVLKKQKYWPVAEKKGWVWSSAGLSDRTLPDFVRRFAQKNSLTIAPDVLRALAAALPHDATGAKNELDKIALAAGESVEVTREHLGVIAHQADMDIFEFISTVIESRSPEKVWKKVFDNRLVSSTDNILFAFLSLLQREAKMLWELAHGDAISGWAPKPVLDRKATLAKRLGPQRIASIWDLVLEAEYGIKTGSRTPEQAFEALVGGLYAAFSPNSAKTTR